MLCIPCCSRTHACGSALASVLRTCTCPSFGSPTHQSEVSVLARCFRWYPAEWRLSMVSSPADVTSSATRPSRGSAPSMSRGTTIPPSAWATMPPAALSCGVSVRPVTACGAQVQLHRQRADQREHREHRRTAQAANDQSQRRGHDQLLAVRAPPRPARVACRAVASDGAQRRSAAMMRR